MTTQLKRFTYEIGHPWEIDFYNDAEWKERTNPPLTELKAAQGAEEKLGDKVNSVYIVWLTNPPRSEPKLDDYDDYYDEPFEQCPSLVARGYLGKYDLILTL